MLEPYADLSFDYVFMIGSLEHMVEHEKALRAAHRVLRPGGVLGVAVPNKAWVNYQKWLLQSDRISAGRRLLVRA